MDDVRRSRLDDVRDRTRADDVRRRVLVSGRVQGVLYRDSCRREAAARGVAGWVRNLGDGRVEAVFEGPSDAVESLVHWAGHGPPRAVVAGVALHDEAVAGLTGFEVR